MTASHYDQRVRPSAWWYLLCAALVFAGLMLGIRQGFSEAGQVADSYERAGVGEVVQLELEAGDTRDVYATWEDERATEELRDPGVTVTVTGPDALDVAASPSSGRVAFADGEHSSLRVATFEAPREGAYRVAADGPPGAYDGIAVGSLDLTGAIVRVLGSIALGLVAGVGLAIVIAIARGRAKRRIRREYREATPLGVPKGATGPITYS
ncbi:MAG: hypothetical protein JWO69_100 [Thermoleophilia bacterium]|nr:hypothetical protein [Thermoleophilia bacterium]